MRGLVKDALDGLLAITVLQKTTAAAASAITSAGKTVTAFPMAVAVQLVTLSCPAAHTLDVVVEGRDEDADAWGVLATFTQITNANIATELKNIATPKKQYRVVGTATGAFGGAGIPYVVNLVGTNVRNAPITQVL